MTITRKRQDEIARDTRDWLGEHGYSTPTLEDVRLEVECILDAIQALSENKNTGVAYRPMFDTELYKDGGAYLAAMEHVFCLDDVKNLHVKAANARRAQLVEAGEWTGKDELIFRNSFNF